jgi:hypothetical protein
MRAVFFAAAALLAAGACTDPDTPRNRETAGAMPDTDAAAATTNATGVAPATAPDAAATNLAPIDPNASVASGGSTGAAGMDASGDPGVGTPK